MVVGEVDRLRELIEYVARELVDNPDAVWVEKMERGNTTIYHLHVAPEDVGRVVGRGGRTADALRALLRAAAKRTVGRVVLEID